MKINPASDMTGKNIDFYAAGHDPAPEKAKTTGKSESARVEINLPRSDDGKKQNSVNSEVKKAIGSVSQMLTEKNIDLKWNFDDKSNSIVIKFIERESNKLIRQVPSEEILKLRQHITEMLGMIYDQKL